MKLTVDCEADALYLQLNDSRIVDSEEVAPGVVLDYNKNDQVVGVEVLGIQRSTADREQSRDANNDIRHRRRTPVEKLFVQTSQSRVRQARIANH